MNCLVNDSTNFNRIARNQFLYIQVSSCCSRIFHWSLLVPCIGIIMFIFLANDSYKRQQTNTRLLCVYRTILVSVTITYEEQGVPGYSQMNCEKFMKSL